MKKLLMFIVIFMVLFLSGCNETNTSNIEDYIPVLELVGDNDVTIELNEEYVDPGVNIIGDFDIDVTTVNNVDNNAYGIYTIDYSLVYKGVTISKSRTVRVVRKMEKDFNIELFILENSSDVLVFTVDVTDPNSKLINPEASLYLGNEKIEVKSLHDGLNFLKFSGLSDQTTYKLEVSGSFLEGTTNILLSTYELFAKTNNNEESIGPKLELVGDSDIELVVGELYTEKGVNIIGDYDLIVDTYSNVDTSKAGTYFVLYTAMYEGITIYINRTVVVLPLDEVIDFSVSIDLLEATDDSLTISLNIDDSDNIINLPTASLYKGDTKIDSKPFTSGSSYITFSGLTEDTTYTFVLEGTYESNGVNILIGDYRLDCTTLKQEKLELSLIGDSVIEMEQSLTFTDPGAEVIGDSKAVINVDMDFSPNVVGNYTITYSTTIDNVLVSITRTVIVTEKVLDFGVSLSLSSSSIDSVTFDLTVASNYDKLSTHTAKLYKGTTLVDEISFTSGTSTLEFTDLEENTEYTLKLIGEYTKGTTLTSFGDYSLTVTTVDDVIYINPYVTNLEVNPTFINSYLQINVYFDLFDPDSTLYGSLYVAIDDEFSTATKVAEVGHNEFIFSNFFIDENEEIELYIMANYKDTVSTSLNEQKLVSYNLTTPVYISVLSFTPSRTFFAGDNVELSLELYNSIGMDIDSIRINEVEYDTFLYPSNNNILYIDMGLKNSEEDITYILKGISVTLVDGTVFEVSCNNSVNVIVHIPGEFIPSDAYFKILEITPTSTFDYVINKTVGEENYIRVSIFVDNRYDLALNKIKINGVEHYSSDFLVEGNEISLTCLLESDYTSFEVNSYSYDRNGETVDGDTLGLIPCSIYQYLNKDVILITTVEQFLAMTYNESKYYLLDNDLDFSDVPVSPLGTYTNPFRGCFDGSGYTLSNIYMETTVANETDSTYFGLFGYNEAFIYDVTIDNIDIVVNSDGSNELYVGSVAGMSSGDIYNVSITGDSSVTINGIVSGQIGGIIGETKANIRDVIINTTILVDAKSIEAGQEGIISQINIGGVTGITTYNVETSLSTGSINVINILNTEYNIGGLVGIASSYDAYNKYISNSYSNMSIIAETTYYSSTGGLIGKSYSPVLNCYASGNIRVTAGHAGGLIGYSINRFYGCFAIGDVISDYASPGNVLGKNSTIYTFNTYKYSGQELYNYGSLMENGSDTYMYTMIYASDVEYNSYNFYIKFLLWNDYYYDFSLLDIANGILPVFK